MAWKWGLLVVVLFAGAVWCTDNVGENDVFYFRCPLNESSGEPIDGDYPDPLNCTCYYTCHDLVAFHRICPAGLHFHTYRKLCMHPVDAQCEVSTTGGPYSTTTMSPGEEDSFFVGRTFILNGKQNPVEFDRIVNSHRNNWDSMSNHFIAFKDGLYFFSVSAGANSYAAADVDLLRNGKVAAGVYRSTRNTDGVDILARDMILPLRRKERMFVSSNDFVGLYSDDEMQTSFSGFRISGIMRRLYAFSVARNRGFASGDYPRIQYPIVQANLDDMFNGTHHYFMAPVNGTYYFSYSIGAKRYSRVEASLYVNGIKFSDIRRDANTHDGIDTISRSSLVDLTKGDTAEILLSSGGDVYSDEGLQTAFQGFLYEPKGSKIAWHVGRTISWEGNNTYFPVWFNRVEINHGSPYDPSKSEVKIKVPGIYFVSFTAGAQAKKVINMALHHNGNEIADLYRHSTIHNGVDIISRTLILQLKRDDTLYISAGRNTALFSDFYMQTSFTGFRLF